MRPTNGWVCATTTSIFLFSRNSQENLTRHVTTMKESGPTKVLVAEDNPVNRRMARKLLGTMGIEVDSAENGSQAVEMARSRSYDLILMDVEMPVMGGLEATRELRRAGIDAPIVAMTGSSMKGDKEQCLDAGMTDYVSKPIDRQAMKAILNKFCDIDGIGDSLDRPSTLSADHGREISQQHFPDLGTVIRKESVPEESFLARVCRELGMLPEEYLDLAEEFIADVGPRLDTLEIALNDQDHEQARQIAHAVKGGAAEMLLEDMAAAAVRIELRARRGDRTGYGDEVDSLRRSLAMFAKQVTEFKSALARIE